MPPRRGPPRRVPLAAGLLLQLLLAALPGPAGAVAAARLGARKARASGRTDAFFFNYNNHGGDWREGQCGSREMQSPVDFDGAAPWVTLAIRDFYFDYSKLEGELLVQNNGHSLAVDVSDQGYGGIMYDNEKFAIASITFHVHSEHTFHGVPFPMEMHLVHKAESSEQALVIAVPFKLYEAPPQVYYYMGSGYCNEGYYAGWKYGNGDAANVTACAQACTREPQCKFFSIVRGVTCSRYLVGPCTYRPSGTSDHQTYQKAPPPLVYSLLGPGHCDWGFYAQDRAASLHECQTVCTGEKQCKFLSFSEGKSRCIRFNTLAATCSPRLNGTLDHVTYRKHEPGHNLALSTLIGADALPEKGQQARQPLPAQMEVLSAFVAGGSYFEYEGSLTAPPCTEDVTWLVRREPLEFSCSQSQLLSRDILKATGDAGNWRAPMPLMDRKISVRHAVPGQPPPPALPAGPTGAPIQGDLAAGATARDALAWASRAAGLAGHIAGATAAHGQPVLTAAGAAGAGATAGAAPPLSLSALSSAGRGGLGGGGEARNQVGAEMRGIEAAMKAEVDRSLWFASRAEYLEAQGPQAGVLL